MSRTCAVLAALALAVPALAQPADGLEALAAISFDQPAQPMGQPTGQPAGQAPGAAKEAQGAGERPWRLSFTPGAEYSTSGDLRSTTGDVSVARAGAALALEIPVAQMSSLAFNFAWQHSWYDWDAATSLGGVANPWDDTDELDLGVRFSSRIDDRWSWFAGLGANSSAEEGADFGDSLTYGGGAGVRWRASDTLTLTGGLLVRSQLEDSANIIPILGVDWKFAQQWSLTTEYKTSIFPAPGIFLKYQPCEAATLALGVSYQTHTFRLSDRDTPVNGVARERRLPVELSLAWKLSPHATLTGTAGIVAWQRYRLDTSDGTLIGQNEADPVGIFGLSANFAF